MSAQASKLRPVRKNSRKTHGSPISGIESRGQQEVVVVVEGRRAKDQEPHVALGVRSEACPVPSASLAGKPGVRQAEGPAVAVRLNRPHRRVRDPIPSAHQVSKATGAAGAGAVVVPRLRYHVRRERDLPLGTRHGDDNE